MYYAMRASAPSLHRESTDSLIYAEGFALQCFSFLSAKVKLTCIILFCSIVYTSSTKCIKSS